MKTLNNVQSKLILALSMLSATAAISLAFHAHGSVIQPATETVSMTAPSVVIIGKKMTDEEKRVYDLAPQEIARVEIVGKRLSVQEKMALAAEDGKPASLTVAHKKA